MNKISIICCSNNEEILYKNLLSSDIIKNVYELIIKRGFTNICKAYNEAMEEASGDILCFVHQDVFMPNTFELDLHKALEELEQVNWGVIGVAGAKKKEEGVVDYCGYILDKGNIYGSEKDLPKEVQTIDELLLIIRKDTFKFDENIENKHLLGTDICCQSTLLGKKNLVVNAFVEHCHNWNYKLPLDYFITRDYIKKKWYKFLPIYTTTSIIE